MARNIYERLDPNTHQWEQDGIETLLQKYSGGILLAQTVPTGGTHITYITHFIRLPETAAEKLYEAIAAWRCSLPHSLDRGTDSPDRTHSSASVPLPADGRTYEAVYTPQSLTIGVSGRGRCGGIMTFSAAEADHLYRFLSRAFPSDAFEADETEQESHR